MDVYTSLLRSRLGNTLLLEPCAAIVVRDAAGRILLQQRADDGSWGLPGGHLVPGEAWLACARREVLEETGWQVRVTGLLGIYSEPGQQTHTYPDGRRSQFVGVVFEGEAERRVQPPDHETLALAFFEVTALPASVIATDRPVLEDAVSSGVRPFVR